MMEQRLASSASMSSHLSAAPDLLVQSPLLLARCPSNLSLYPSASTCERASIKESESAQESERGVEEKGGAIERLRDSAQRDCRESAERERARERDREKVGRGRGGGNGRKRGTTSGRRHIPMPTLVAKESGGGEWRQEGGARTAPRGKGNDVCAGSIHYISSFRSRTPPWCCVVERVLTCACLLLTETERSAEGTRASEKHGPEAQGEHQTSPLTSGAMTVVY